MILSKIPLMGMGLIFIASVYFYLTKKNQTFLIQIFLKIGKVDQILNSFPRYQYSYRLAVHQVILVIFDFPEMTLKL